MRQDDLGIGLPGLKENNMYFGNAPKQTIKIKKDKIELVYGTKSVLAMQIPDKYKNSYGKIFVKIFEMIGFTGLTEEVRNKYISENIRSFDSVYEKEWTPIYKQKGKKSIFEGYSKPKMISKANLITKHEFEIISKLASIAFLGLDEIRQNWKDLINQYDYRQISAAVHECCVHRTHIREAYGRVTTRRLQDMRNFFEKPNANKASFSDEDLTKFLQTRTNRISEFMKELRVIFGDDLEELILSAYLNKNVSISKSDINKFMMHKIFTDTYGEFVKEDEKSDIELPQIFIDEQLFNRVSNILNSIANQIQHTRGVIGKLYKSYNRDFVFKSLSEVKANLNKTIMKIIEFDKLENVHHEYAYTLMMPNKIISHFENSLELDGFIKKCVMTLERIISHFDEDNFAMDIVHAMLYKLISTIP